MSTFGADKCVTVAVTLQDIQSWSDHSVGAIVSKEAVNKGCVHSPKSRKYTTQTKKLMGKRERR